MYSGHATRSYQHTNVATVAPSALIVKLYEGILRFIDEAEDAIQRADVKHKGLALRRAGRILEELSSSLNHEIGGELAAQLVALYDYLNYELSEANLSSQLRHLQNARRVTEILLAAWRELDRDLKAQSDQQAPHERSAEPELSISA